MVQKEASTGASRLLEKGLKGTSRGLQKGFKGASEGLQGGFKGASRGLQGPFQVAVMATAAAPPERGRLYLPCRFHLEDAPQRSRSTAPLACACSIACHHAGFSKLSSRYGGCCARRICMAVGCGF